MATEKKRSADLKVVIMGDAAIGKTSLIYRYIEGSYKDQITTLGASFSLKQWGPYNVALWDTAGEERFSGLSKFYCRGASVAILAYDVTKEDSFHALRARFVQLLEAANDNCLSVIVGTKMDLLLEAKEREVQREDAIQLARELNENLDLEQLPVFETSAKTGHNVEKVFSYLLNVMLPLTGGKKQCREFSFRGHLVAAAERGRLPSPVLQTLRPKSEGTVDLYSSSDLTPQEQKRRNRSGCC